jgi:tripartite-type tricarboxylate transporter receptor subunit TctC
MDMKAKWLIFSAMAFVHLFAQAGVAQEDVSKYPSKPISFISPVPAGQGTDLSIRLLAKELEKILGQPVVVLNKPGAALTIGAAAVATAKPDGYTIGFTGGPPLYFTPLMEKVPYDPFKDLRMVAQYGALNVAVAVKGDSPFKTFRDVVDYARQNPKKLTYGTTGAKSITNITMERIAKQENVQITHIPFKGTPETQTALLGGHIMVACGDFGGSSLVNSGDVRFLMMMREEKSQEYPNVPILQDLGYNIPYVMIMSVITARAVPDPIVKKLDDAIAKAMKEPTFLSGMKDLHLPVMYRSGKELDPYIAKNYEYYSKLLKELGLIK